MKYPVEAALSQWYLWYHYLALKSQNSRFPVLAAHSFAVGGCVALISLADSVLLSMAVEIEDLPAGLGILTGSMMLDRKWVALEEG